MTLSTMESFSRRLLSSPSCEVDLDESGCNSPAASVYTHTHPLLDYPFHGQVLEKGGREVEGRSVLSAVVVRLSLALSTLDLEESGVSFSSARSENGLRRASDMFALFVVVCCLVVV